MNSGILICIIGIDGSGKSTLAKALVTKMSGNRVKTKYWWCKFESFKFESLMIRLFKTISRASALCLIGRNKNEDNRYSAKLAKNSLPSIIYQYFVLFSYVYRIFLNVRLPLLFGKSVICDRYVYDTVTDFVVDFGYSKEKIQTMLKIFFCVVPKPQLVFLIDLPEEIAYQRNLPKHDISSVTYLSIRRRIYLNINGEHKMTLLDGTKNLRDLESEVQSKVKEVVG